MGSVSDLCLLGVDVKWCAMCCRTQAGARAGVIAGAPHLHAGPWPRGHAQRGQQSRSRFCRPSQVPTTIHLRTFMHPDLTATRVESCHCCVTETSRKKWGLIDDHILIWFYHRKLCCNYLSIMRKNWQVTTEWYAFMYICIYPIRLGI